MREIKFRAWNGSKMIVPQENSYYQHYVSFCGGIVQKSSEGMECLGGGDNWRMVDNTIMMQYTGLKDRNGTGNEMCQGDIVVAAGLGVGVVNKNSWGEWGLVINDGFESIHDLIMERDLGTIVGNIHENPELLEREA